MVSAAGFLFQSAVLCLAGMAKKEEIHAELYASITNHWVIGFLGTDDVHIVMASQSLD